MGCCHQLQKDLRFTLLQGWATRVSGGWMGWDLRFVTYCFYVEKVVVIDSEVGKRMERDGFAMFVHKRKLLNQGGYFYYCGVLE